MVAPHAAAIQAAASRVEAHHEVAVEAHVVAEAHVADKIVKQKTLYNYANYS